MSNRYTGGIISATPPTLVAGAGASGTWTLEQQMQANAAGLWPVNAPFYIEDVFSTWLYTGTGATQTITNGIDLAGDGGLVWVKARSTIGNHRLFDTDRGVLKPIYSNLPNAQATEANTLTAFNANGFTLGSDSGVNQNTQTWASWTFRKQPKFFDCVTYTGNGVAGRQIAHNLGSAVGCLIVKCTSAAEVWQVWHRTFTGSQRIRLNTTDAVDTAGGVVWNGTAPTSTVFTVGDNGVSNGSGQTYVAYLFAHDAGGFGESGEDNVISCGSYTGNGSANGPEINLGYEPQWLLTKRTDLSADWQLVDTMRGMASAYYRLFPNMTAIEDFESDGVTPTATGFKLTGVQPTQNASGGNYIYIAIRRGPMKVPESGTSVFAMDTGSSPAPALTSGFPVDAALWTFKSSTFSRYLAPRLTQGSNLQTNSTSAESADASSQFGYMDGFGTTGLSDPDIQGWMFQRAPGFMDVCPYAGTSVARTQAHNLGVAPELLIVKNRSTTTSWFCYVAPLGIDNYVTLNGTAAATSGGGAAFWNSTLPTASVFSLSNTINTNRSGDNYVAYLFATLSGVSKVGSYTGTGATQVINCGFTGGARFVLVKATSTTGNWLFWDSLRGIVAGNDPYLTLNTDAAQVTNTDWVDTAATGFELSSAGGNLANSNGVSYIFLAIA